MYNKIGTIIKIEGSLLQMLAAVFIVPFFIALSNGEKKCANIFLVIIVVCTALSYIARKIFSLSHYNFKSRDGFLIVALSWFVISLVGAIPFVASGSIPNFADAFFESCSGFSTTGASILEDIEIMPRSILFWRSFTHWLGGMGVIVLIAALLPSFGLNGQIMANAETTGPTKDKIMAKFSDSAKVLYGIYIFMTIAETILLLVGGMNLYDALIHTFGTVGTGGMSSYNNSIMHFNSTYIEIVIAIFMMLAAVNFNLYYAALRHGIKRIFQDAEFRFYICIILGAGILITLCNAFYSSFEHFGKTTLDAFFQTISIITTTGYASADYDLWPTFSKFVIFALFFIGGCSSSTGGGVKGVRILVCLKLIRRGVSVRLHPNRIVPLTLNGKEVSTNTTIRISNFIFTYVLVLFAGFLLISLNGFDFMTNLSAAASCLGNVGPGFNLVGPSMNYSIFSDFSKYVFSALMIIGRLELYTVLVLFSRYYIQPNRTM
jgi:trk system potassium uptake protein TrkH